MSNDPISLTVNFRGKAHSLSLLPDCTLAHFQSELEELTEVPPSLQKLLYKGKKQAGSDVAEDVTISQVGIKSGVKIQLIGSTMKELDSMRAVENENQQRERIMRERATKAPVKVSASLKSSVVCFVQCFAQLRSTGSSSFASTSLQYRFHELRPLEHLPNPASALALLRRLSEDPAIKHIMQTHKFVVGVLTELAPHEHPGLLGLNENAGQAIKLRLRTDKYDGFRVYSEVRRVLCHELTHNVWGDHDENVRTLPSAQYVSVLHS